MSAQQHDGDQNTNQQDPSTVSAQSQPQSDGEKEIEALRARVVELTNQWKRTAADLANYKKQVEEEKKSWAMFSLVASVTQFLPILDTVNSALAAQPNLDSVDGAFKQFLIGLGRIQKQFDDALAQMGVVEVAGVNAAFDPTIHESVSTDGEVTGKGSLVVSSVLTKGYQFQGQLIRPARVVVKEVLNKEVVNQESGITAPVPQDAGRRGEETNHEEHRDS